MTASNSFWWKQIAVNCWLALTLTLKMASFAPSLNFLDTFVGIAFYAFFSGNFNTSKDTWDKTQACYEKTHALKDIFEVDNCQEVVIPVYFYALAALSVCLAALYIFLISMMFIYKNLVGVCCPATRKLDF